MLIESSAFKNNEYIPSKYTCDGDDINPPILISETPQATKSLVLIMDDPDAPMGTWVHWVVWNINSNIQEIAENSVPDGSVEGMTSFGQPGYGGPCPHSGSHRYFFKIYSLDAMFNIPIGADKLAVEEAMKNHILAQAELVGLYKRK